MKVKKLQLKNGYKRFHDLTIDLGTDPKRIIALVGPNGCGKSSVLDGLLFHNSAYHSIGNKERKDHHYHSMSQTPNFDYQNIIIDLRGNTGGNSMVVVEFLRYIDVRTYSLGKKMLVRLSDDAQKQRGYLGNSGLFSVSLEKMKNRIFEQLKFNGSIYVLIDNATYSAGSDFATTLSDNELATTIGRPTGGRPTSYGDLLNFQLNHSKISYSISHKQFIRASKEKRYDDALYPDYEVIYTIEDILEGRDLDMGKALELIGIIYNNEK